MKNKKKIFAIFTILITGFVFLKGFDSIHADEVRKDCSIKSVSEKAKTEKSENNKTIRALVKEYKDKDEEYINQMMNYPDSQIIIANPDGGGGFFTNEDPNFVGAGAVITHSDGSRTVVDTRSPDAATVGEIKEALKQAKLNQ